MSDTTDLTMTDMQAQILGGLEQVVVAAERAAKAAVREREIALAMVLAGHGLAKAEVVGMDVGARVIRIKKEPTP